MAQSVGFGACCCASCDPGSNRTALYLFFVESEVAVRGPYQLDRHEPFPGVPVYRAAAAVAQLVLSPGTSMGTFPLNPFADAGAKDVLFSPCHIFLDCSPFPPPGAHINRVLTTVSNLAYDVSTPWGAAALSYAGISFSDFADCGVVIPNYWRNGTYGVPCFAAFTSTRICREVLTNTAARYVWRGRYIQTDLYRASTGVCSITNTVSACQTDDWVQIQDTNVYAPP